MKTLYVILAVGVGLRVLMAVAMGSPLSASDAGNYYADAIRILEQRDVALAWSPGVPILLAGWMYIWGKSAAAIIAFGITGYVMFFVGMEEVGQMLGIPSSRRLWLHGIFALYPSHVYQSVAPLTHIPVAALLLWAMYFHRKGIAGCLAAIYTLMRPAAAVVAVFQLGFSWKKWLLFLVPIGGWLLLVHTQTGQWQLSRTNEKNFFLGNNPHTPLYETWWLGSHHAHDTLAFNAYLAQLQRENITFTQAAWQHIRQESQTFALRTANRLRTFWAFDIFAGAEWLTQHPDATLVGYALLALDAACWGLLLLGACATLLLQGHRIDEAERAILYLIGLYALPYCFAFSHPTYHMAVASCVGLLAAKRWDCISMIFQGKSLKNINLSMLALFLAMIFIQIEWISYCATR